MNIDSKGYGKIYKAIMRNRELPLLAKTIYAYFCAYAGNGFKAFPKRDKIVRDLQMNKDTYTKHLNRLVKGEYIAKERTNNGNLYTVMQSIPIYDGEREKSLPEDNPDEPTDILVFENVGARGFGTVPKLVMLDTRLSAQAKGIYAYFASFAGTGTTAFPHRSTVMRELKIRSTNTYYAHLDQLVEHGFLTIEQQKERGRFSVCTYRLNEVVEPEPAPTRQKRTVKRTSEKLRHRENGISTPLDTIKGEPEIPISEKLLPGGKLAGNADSTSEKVMSEKLSPEKTVSQNFGQPYTSNISTRNSYFMTEQEDHHQRRPWPIAVEPLTNLSTAEVKERIGYEHLREEAEGWGTLLKCTLGSLENPEDEARYKRTMEEILTEIVDQTALKSLIPYLVVKQSVEVEARLTAELETTRQELAAYKAMQAPEIPPDERLQQQDQELAEMRAWVERTNHALKAAAERERGLTAELSKLRREVKAKDEKIASHKSDKRELAELREALYQISKSQEEPEIIPNGGDETTFPCRDLPEGIVCFGGHKQWIGQMQKKLPGVRFVPVNYRYDSNIIKRVPASGSIPATCPTSCITALSPTPVPPASNATTFIP